MTMRKLVQFALAVLLVAIAGVIVWQVLRLRELVYKGKPLSVWLQSYGPDRDSPEVDDAVRTMGTNVIPALLGMLRAEDSQIEVTLAALGFRYTPAKTQHLRAQKGLSALGADASNAVPALIEIYKQNTSPAARQAAANSLVEIGPAAKTAIPALIKSAASTNSDVRAFALYTLGRMALESELVVPVLIKGLRDPDREVRNNAAFGLGALAFMGGDAKSAITSLVETLKDTHPSARASAAMAL